MNHSPVIRVALAEVYPSESQARAAIQVETGQPVTETYCGLWSVPLPERTLVHLFTDVAPDVLATNGWRLGRSVPPGGGDVVWSAEELEQVKVRARERAAEIAPYVD